MQQQLLLTCYTMLASALFIHYGVLANNNGGVHFQKIHDNNQLESAIEEYGFPVFLYFGAAWCEPCVRMESNVFADADVGHEFNNHFISLKVDHEEANKKSFQERIGDIMPMPAMYFLDETGNIIHQMSGYQTKEALLIQAELASHYNTDLLKRMAEKFNDGNRDPDFLYDFIQVLEGANKIDSQYVNAYWNNLPEEALTEERNLSFIYEYALTPPRISEPDESAHIESDLNAVSYPEEFLEIKPGGKGFEFKKRPEAMVLQEHFGLDKLYVSYPLFNTPMVNLSVKNEVYNFLIENREKFTELYPEEQVDLRILLIASSAAKKAIEKGEEALFEPALKGLESITIDQNKSIYQIHFPKRDAVSYWFPFAHEVDKGFTTNIKRAFYLTSGQYDAYMTVMDAYIESIWNNSDKLSRTAYRYLDRYDERWLLERGQHWIERAVELDPKFATHAIYALYMDKLGEDNAFAALKKEALENASEANQSLEIYERLAQTEAKE